MLSSSSRVNIRRISTQSKINNDILQNSLRIIHKREHLLQSPQNHKYFPNVQFFRSLSSSSLHSSESDDLLVKEKEEIPEADSVSPLIKELAPLIEEPQPVKDSPFAITPATEQPKSPAPINPKARLNTITYDKITLFWKNYASGENIDAGDGSHLTQDFITKIVERNYQRNQAIEDPSEQRNPFRNPSAPKSLKNLKQDMEPWSMLRHVENARFCGINKPHYRNVPPRMESVEKVVRHLARRKSKGEARFTKLVEKHFGHLLKEAEEKGIDSPITKQR